MDFVSIEEIVVNNKYLRVDAEVDDLVKSIKQIGVINPLVVNDKKELIAGGRRYKALKEIGVEQVPVVYSDKSPLELELISIDENLIRKELTKIEFENCLRRGKEIYDQINPDVIKDEELEQLKEAQKKDDASANFILLDESRIKTFVEQTAEKTGLSEKVIHSAIQRDCFSSKELKKSRKDGDINASQANELIKLSREEQNEIIPHVFDRTVKEIREIVKDVKSLGVEKTIENTRNIIRPSKEHTNINNLSKKLNKEISKILLEQVPCEGEIRENIEVNLNKLKSTVDELLEIL